MAIRTIFSMAEDCARGQRQGWLWRHYTRPLNALLSQPDPWNGGARCYLFPAGALTVGAQVLHQRT